MNKKKAKIKYLVLVITITLVMSLISLSFAYLAGVLIAESDTDIKVTLGEKAELVFSKGDDFNISAGSHNMLVDGPNLSTNTTTSVKLTSYGNYTTNYYIYFDINYNDFIYTTEEQIPELML